ncbi:MAG: hypothetical protein LBF00_02245 [Mycoplasmataceae bacterium]|jgi:hypothetical protein|nr:hypothetical protein [Mycoplasmataceae bacterium]
MNIEKITKQARKRSLIQSVGVKTTRERHRKLKIYCRIHKTNINHLMNTFITECLLELEEGKK